MERTKGHHWSKSALLFLGLRAGIKPSLYTGCPNGWWVQSLWRTPALAHRLQLDNSLIPPGPCFRESLSRKFVLQDICRDVDPSICLWLSQIGTDGGASEEWGILHCKIVSLQCAAVWVSQFFSLSCASTKVWLLLSLLLELPGRWTLETDKMSQDSSLSSSWSAHYPNSFVAPQSLWPWWGTALRFSKLSFLKFLMR